MSRVLLSALLLTSCAPEVAPHADPGHPRVLPVGATAALDGSFSEGDGLSYAWAVEPEGATLLDAESPFATLIAEAPGLYTVSLEVCDDAGRCDQAETWARVDAPGNTSRISDWSPDLFGGAESGAGLPGGFKDDEDDLCDRCRQAAKGTSSQWVQFCKSLPDDTVDERSIRGSCQSQNLKASNVRNNWCSNYFCD